MFGTGTRGFVIITSFISSGTYVVVFGLLHPPSRQTLAAFLKKVSIPDVNQKWIGSWQQVLRKILQPEVEVKNAGKIS